MAPELPSPLPFKFLRSTRGNLPVYTDLKNNGAVFTVVRKYAGDQRVLADALEQLCAQPVTLFHGRIAVRGRHKERIETWLRDLGF